MKTIIIAGLGNPGKEYEETRHNAGFMFVDYFRGNDAAPDFSDWEFSKKLNSEICSGKYKERKIILLKPQTFMNPSGEAVAAAKKYFKVKLENIFVAHDEIDLPLGTFRFSKNSSSAGHQGAQNIIDRLKTKDFTRIRIGIGGKKDKKIATKNYVLGKFTSAELRNIKNAFKGSTVELLRYLS
jgi:peptidyl-tRNA hydrolase, PTH1 family